jgi:DNA-binding transcriptional ArsR family regulator
MRTAPPLDAAFAALADPTRRAILSRLAAGEATVTELAAPFAMTQPAVSSHLKVLERAGLISRGRDAQRRPCRLEVGPLLEATAWIERTRQVWATNYERLDAVLDELAGRAPVTRAAATRAPAAGEPTPAEPPPPAPTRRAPRAAGRGRPAPRRTTEGT